MARKKNRALRQGMRRPPAHRSLLLTLSVVPMVAGGLLAVAALLGLSVVGTDPGRQALFGVMLALLGFAASNAAQRNLYPAIGWLLIDGAGLALLTASPALAVPLGIGLALAGTAVLGWEFYRRIGATIDAGGSRR